MIKYLGWKWYDWILLIPVGIWVLVITVIMSSAVVVEYMLYESKRMVRENQFYERHDFGEVEDKSTLDDMDLLALREMTEEHVIGNFIYKSKAVKIWVTLITFGKAGTLR